MTESKPAVHTATPWKREGSEIVAPTAVVCILTTADGERVGLRTMHAESVDANARLIVRAVNSHQALVEALRGCVSMLRGAHSPEAISQTIVSAERALALAEEQK